MKLELTDLINYILIGIEGSIFFLFAETFFAPSKRRIITFAVWFFALLIEYPLVFTINGLIIKPLIMLLFFTAVTKTSYNAKWLPALFCCVTSFVVAYLLDMLVITMFSVITSNSFDILIQQPELYLAISFISKFSAAFLAVLIRVFAQELLHGKSHHWTYHLSCCIFPASSLICALCLLSVVQIAPEVSILLLGCMLFLLFSDIGSVFLLGYMEEQNSKLTHSVLLQKELDSALANLTSARQSYENERKLTHDFQNQMSVIKGMLEKSEENKEALAYISSVFQKTGSESLSVTTNRTAIDVLLDLKYQAAKELHIDFLTRLDDLSAFPMPDNALVVLLSNLLDNAIEACSKLPEATEKTIIIKMQVQSAECLIYVKNTAVSIPKSNRGVFHTSKPDRRQHGFGMKNITAIVEQYGGIFTINQEDNWFAFAAIFPGVLG